MSNQAEKPWSGEGSVTLWRLTPREPACPRSCHSNVTGQAKYHPFDTPNDYSEASGGPADQPEAGLITGRVTVRRAGADDGVHELLGGLRVVQADGVTQLVQQDSRAHLRRQRRVTVGVDHREALGDAPDDLAVDVGAAGGVAAVADVGATGQVVRGRGPPRPSPEGDHQGGGLGKVALLRDVAGG